MRRTNRLGHQLVIIHSFLKSSCPWKNNDNVSKISIEVNDIVSFKEKFLLLCKEIIDSQEMLNRKKKSSKEEFQFRRHHSLPRVMFEYKLYQLRILINEIIEFPAGDFPWNEIDEKIHFVYLPSLVIFRG